MLGDGGGRLYQFRNEASELLLSSVFPLEEKASISRPLSCKISNKNDAGSFTASSFSNCLHPPIVPHFKFRELYK